jgi:antirestriction protein ArdC
MARASRVFNVTQVDGYVINEPSLDDNRVDPVESAEAFVAATGARLVEGGDRAFYSIREDAITMPDRYRFIDTKSGTATEAFYATLLHELTHWTGASHRLDRQFGERFGDDAYAMEELVAELGAAFLCGDLGISAEPRADHAAYIDSWLRILKGDRKAIFAAASAASKAAEFLNGFGKAREKSAA